MAQSVASAAVDILPTFKGGPRELERAMGPALDRAGKSGGEQYGSSLVAGIMSSSAVTKLIGAGGVGAVLFAGINRVKAIDTAQAKLRGLGNDAAAVDKIMQNALASVKGTAFGLDDAVTVAAQLTAAQIPAGQQLESVLKSVANAAAASGSSLSEMGSIYAKVASLNKAQNDSLQQVADRGLPIYQSLAKQLGVTADQVFKMASAGEIGFAQFAAAMTDAAGTVASEMGNTIEGRVDNLMAAVGRLGAGLAGSSLTQGKDVLAELTQALDGLTPIATALGNAAGSVLSVLNAIPGPVKAAAVAVIALNVAMRSNAFAALAGQMRGFATTLGVVTSVARSSGSAILGLRAGMSVVGSVAKTAGTAMLGAFGGPVGLAIAGVGIALGGLIALWQEGEAAAQAQKAAIDEITASLDQNTGAVTDNTFTTIAKQLQDSGVLDQMEALGLSVDGVGKAIAEGGPELDMLKSKLQGIIDLNWAQSYNGQQYINKTGMAARDILDVVTQKSEEQAAALRQLQQATKAAGDENKKGAKSFETLSDAIDAAFNSTSRMAAQTSAVQGLADAIAENGKVIDSTTRGGVANLDALQRTIQAMAENAGDNYGVFVTNVSALMSYLDKQGVNTQNVMGAVRASIQNVAGKNWNVYLNGGQLIAESQRIVKALKVLVEAQAAADGSDRRLYQGQIDKLNLQLQAIRSVTSSFKGSASASGGAASGYTKVGSSAKKTKTDLAALRKEVYLLAKDWLKPSAYSSEAVSLIDQINSAYKEGAISKKNRASLITSVKKTDKELTRIAKAREAKAQEIEDANQKVADAIAARDTYRQSIIDGFKNLGDISKFATETQKTITEVYTQGDRLVSVVKQVTSKGSASDMLEGLRKQVDEAAKFKEAFNDLKKLGLNDTSLQNLMGEFLSSGDSSIATSLLNGGKSAVSEVNDLMKQLGDLTGSETKGWAKDVTDSMYQAGISTAEGFLKGLQSQDSKLKSQYDKMANDLLTTIKKKLGIKSPSREMGKLAEYTSQGWNNNLHLDPVTPGIDVGQIAPTTAGTGASMFDGMELWLMLDDDRPVRGVVQDVLRGEARQKIAMRRGGNR